MKTYSFFTLINSDLKAFKRLDNIVLSTWANLLHPKFIPNFLIRLAQIFYKYKLTRILSYIFSYLNTIFFGIEVTPKCHIGLSLSLPHTVGTVIGAHIIGNNVTIFQGVTLGAKFVDLNYDKLNRPCIGDNVIIGAGAKILGAVTIGDNSIIASNSLVTDTIPNNSYAIGVPATIKINIKVNDKIKG
jgi:serine O-acetyltransferase